MTQRVSMSIEQWIALREDGAEVPPIWFTAVGGSMRPLIRVNCDQVMLMNVDPQEIRVGDIVLFPCRFATANYRLHRVYQLDGNSVQTFGDFNLAPDGRIQRAYLLQSTTH